MRKRKRLSKKNFKTNKTKQKLIDIELMLQQSHKRERDKAELDASLKIKSNPKYFYSYAKRFTKTKPKVGPLKNPTTNKLTSDSQEMANILQKQYCSVFTTPKTDYSFLNSIETKDSSTLEHIIFTEDDFIQQIDTIPTNSAAGPDGLPAKFFKMCKKSLSKPLKMIWQNNFDKGTTPEILKTSHITPIFKKGDQGLPENYRPVALTSITTKIFEKIVREKLQTHLEENNLYNPTQHGFRPGRSCLSQLLAHVERLISHLQNNENVDVIYLDFSKAFDKVDHQILLHKLQIHGIKGQLLNWIRSFLTERYQKVSVNTFLSDEAKVTSGVPQGSVLGPLLFLVMISDIDEKIKHSILSSFADDTRLMKAISCAADVSLLQDDLDIVYDWTSINNMELNGKKFEHIAYGKNEQLTGHSVYKSNVQQPIEIKSAVKDIGILSIYIFE